MRAQTSASYEEQWDRYKWLRNFFIGAVVIWAVPVGFEGIQLAFFIAWTAVVSVLTALLLKWKCPRCGNVFSGGRKHWILLPAKCVSCGLPKYSTDPNAPVIEPGNTQA